MDLAKTLGVGGRCAGDHLRERVLLSRSFPLPWSCARWRSCRRVRRAAIHLRPADLLHVVRLRLRPRGHIERAGVVRGELRHLPWRRRRGAARLAHHEGRRHAAFAAPERRRPHLAPRGRHSSTASSTKAGKALEDPNYATFKSAMPAFGEQAHPRRDRCRAHVSQESVGRQDEARHFHSGVAGVRKRAGPVPADRRVGRWLLPRIACHLPLTQSLPDRVRWLHDRRTDSTYRPRLYLAAQL